MMWESHASLTAYSRSAMRSCPKLRSSSILGSYSRVRHELSGRSEDRDRGTLYWWYRESWEWKQSCWFTGRSASLLSPTVLIGLDSDWKNEISEWAFSGGRLRYGEKFRVQPLVLTSKRSQLRWFGHLTFFLTKWNHHWKPAFCIYMEYFCEISKVKHLYPWLMWV